MEFSDHRQPDDDGRAGRHGRVPGVVGKADAEPTLPTMNDLDRLAADLDRVDATLEALDRGVIGHDSVGSDTDRQDVPVIDASA